MSPEDEQGRQNRAPFLQLHKYQEEIQYPTSKPTKA